LALSNRLSAVTRTRSRARAVAARNRSIGSRCSILMLQVSSATSLLSEASLSGELCKACTTHRSAGSSKIIRFLSDSRSTSQMLSGESQSSLRRFASSVRIRGRSWAGAPWLHSQMWVSSKSLNAGRPNHPGQKSDPRCPPEFLLYEPWIPAKCPAWPGAVAGRFPQPASRIA